MKKTFASEQLPLQPTENAPFHPRVHLDRVGHEHHRAGFRANLIARSQREDDCLHVVADDFVCDHDCGSVSVSAVSCQLSAESCELRAAS